MYISLPSLSLYLSLYLSLSISLSLYISQYIVAPAELNSRTVWLSVWDWDRFGRNQFLGESRLPLASLDLNDTSERWYTLQDKVSQTHMLFHW